MQLEKRSSFGWGATAAGSAPCRNGLVVHYDGSNQGLANKTHEACRTYWKNTRKFHMGSRGWADIGYSFGVCPHGVVMEGRGFGRQQAAQPGGNTTWTSCTFMSGPKESPTAAQVNAFKELRAYLRGKGLASAIRGHRQFVSTSCPGDILYAMVKDGSLTGAPTTTPKPDPEPEPKPPVNAPQWPGTYLRYPPMLKTNAARTWQARMKARGWSIDVDGYYGSESVAVCKAFQREKNLTADGVVGPKTWAAAWSSPIT